MRLNLDAGEHPDEPEELWALFDVVHVACGGHAGDATSMARVAAYCARRAAAGARPVLGAHPAYPDRENFGRRSIALGTAPLTRAITAQCAALAEIARAHDLTVTEVKPHGALYHDAIVREPVARALLRGVLDALGAAVVITGAPHGALANLAAELGVSYRREGFADRARRADGTLVPRGEPGALIVDPVAAVAQVRALAGEVDTICVHSDSPVAIAIARAVREAIDG